VSEFDHIPIETSEGHRPPSPAGDRLLIGLAAVALSGGLLIATANLLGVGDPGIANGSPSPTARAHSTPRPSPTERPRIDFTVEPGTPPAASVPVQPFSGWIRAQTDLVLRIGPVPNALEVGVLAKDAIAYADAWGDSGPAERGWLHVLAPSPIGWIATPVGGTDLVERYAPGQNPGSASVWQIVAGAEGFVAIGTPPSMTGDYPAPVVLTSADGGHWHESSTEIFNSMYGWGPSTVAWGPAGWLAISAVDSGSGSTSWVWQSADGVRWRPLGAMGGLPKDATPSRLVASEVGYLLSVGNPRSGGASSLFASRDGVTWHESADPALGREAWVQVAATSIGFLAWDGAEGIAQTKAPLFSLDGRTWSATDGPRGDGLQITSLADQIIAVDLDPESGAPRIWLGTAAGDGIAWLRDQDSDEAFRGARVTNLVSDGLRAVAVGWEIATDEPLTWAFSGERWRRSTLPHEFRGGIPRLAAGGPAGIVVLGYRPTVRGANPTFWHRTTGGGWVPELSPVFEVVPDPGGEECGALPNDALTYSVVDRPMAVACFGTAPITLRAWATRCDGCYWAASGREPAWLMGANEQQLFLSPIASSDWGGTTAVVDPSLPYDPSWEEQWLEVTGHFDDPAAAECRWTPGPDEMGFYEGRQAVIDQCRQQFVVTAVAVVDGP
jgi:hypothetical protein